MKIQTVTLGNGDSRFQVYDSGAVWIATFVHETDALLFIATKAKATPIPQATKGTK